MPPVDPVLALAAAALGATAMITQIVLLRESLSVFFGNELVMGTILALWMIITGLGALTGKVVKKIPLSLIFLFLGLMPGVSVVFLRTTRNLFFDPGAMMDLGTILSFSTAVLFPFCFVSGLTFPVLSHLAQSRREENPIPRIYSWEALGSVIGGVIFSLLFVLFLTNLETLILLASLNALVAILAARKEKISLFLVLSTLIIAISIVFLTILDLDKVTKEYLFPNQRLITFKDTPYGNVTVTDRDGQLNFYENGLLLFSHQDPITLEESVHYAMARHPHPRSVLLVSGGFTGLVREILKYPEVEKVDYVELNPALTELGKLYNRELENPKIRIVNADARLFIKKVPRIYDVVLINLPDPQTAQINRFYTDEFFQELKSALNDKSIVSFALSSSADYLSKEAREFKGSIIATVKKNFVHVSVVAATKDFVLASNSPLAPKVIPLVEERGLNNTYVNRYYIDEELMMQRSKLIMASLPQESRINKDFSPIGYFHCLKLWITSFETNRWVWFLALLFVLPFLLMWRSVNTITYGLFTAGFSASAIEVIVLISFQALYGYVYQMLGVIITSFMAGLGLGARYKKSTGKLINHFFTIQYGLAFCCFLLPVMLSLWASILREGFYPLLFFLSITFLSGLLMGAQFSLASFLGGDHIASRAASLYGCDLIGAALGAIIISTLLIPVLGIFQASLIVGFLNLMSGSVALWNRKKYYYTR